EVGGHKLTTRITQRSLNAMNLKLGQTCFAFLKTVSVATSDIIT
ncbi:MAG: molybdenum ABC transporter ATP-binding protein, partial [Marinovum sp.]|nr:molybdenum ABC transporter ATP-binding protein [Marinovum sp.]